MTAGPTNTSGRTPKALPKIDAIPERIARSMFSAVKRPDPSIRVPTSANRKPPPSWFSVLG